MESLAPGYGLIEGPLWEAGRGLLFSDVLNGGVFCLDPVTSKVQQVLEHRRGIGGLALHASGGLIVSGRNVACKPPGGGETQVLLDRDAMPGLEGFNDLTTDAAGRIYVGSLAFSAVAADATPKPGYLHIIDLDGSSRVLSPDILLTNGLGVSPDGRRLYHSDTLAHQVWLYDLDARGDASKRRPFCRMGDGHPDGLAVSQDGAVWVAMAHGGACVQVFEPSGKLRTKLPVPLPMVTSVCFGGDDLRDLYVVTGSRDAGRDNAGTIYRVRVDVPGLPVHPARVALPAA